MRLMISGAFEVCCYGDGGLPLACNRNQTGVGVRRLHGGMAARAVVRRQQAQGHSSSAQALPERLSYRAPLAATRPFLKALCDMWLLALESRSTCCGAFNSMHTTCGGTRFVLL